MDVGDGTGNLESAFPFFRDAACNGGSSCCEATHPGADGGLLNNSDFTAFDNGHKFLAEE